MESQVGKPNWKAKLDSSFETTIWKAKPKRSASKPKGMFYDHYGGTLEHRGLGEPLERGGWGNQKSCAPLPAPFSTQSKNPSRQSLVREHATTMPPVWSVLEPGNLGGWELEGCSSGTTAEQSQPQLPNVSSKQLSKSSAGKTRCACVLSGWFPVANEKRSSRFILGFNQNATQGGFLTQPYV